METNLNMCSAKMFRQRIYLLDYKDNKCNKKNIYIASICMLYISIVEASLTLNDRPTSAGIHERSVIKFMATVYQRGVNGPESPI